MKISSLLFLICISLTAFGQEVTEKKHRLVIYQDSVEMPQHAYWEHSDPEDIKVVRSKEDPYKETIYFKAKNPRTSESFNFLSLKDIEGIYTGLTKRSTLFLFNNKLVEKNLGDPKIDSSFISSVEVIKSEDITQIKDKVSEFTIVNVKLQWKYGDRAPKHIATAGVPKFYFAQIEEKKEIRIPLPSEYRKPKEVRGFHFLGLKDIEKKYTGATSPSTLFFLDEELLTSNLSSYQIDSSYVYKVEVLPSTGIEYLKDNLPVFTILKISLATPENTRPKGYLRGYETAMKQ